MLAVPEAAFYATGSPSRHEANLVVATLEALAVGAQVEGLVPGTAVSILSLQWHGSDSATVVYRVERNDCFTGNSICMSCRDRRL
jgi:hypothetical protein